MSRPRTLVHGVGVNDAEYATARNSPHWVCPIYARWSEMLRRCYSEPHKAKNPTYRDCTCYEPWHRFSEFRKWMLCQDWEGMNLDKDILVPGNSVYGPYTCTFVTPRINRLLEDSRASRGEHPIGAHWFKPKRRFCAKMHNGNRSIHIGYFDRADDAHKAYLAAKSVLVRKIADAEQRPEIRDALRLWAELIKTGDAYRERSELVAILTGPPRPSVP